MLESRRNDKKHDAADRNDHQKQDKPDPPSWLGFLPVFQPETCKNQVQNSLDKNLKQYVHDLGLSFSFSCGGIWATALA